MGTVTSQDGVSRWPLAAGPCIPHLRDAEGRGVALPVSRCLCCFGVRASFEMEEPDGALPTDNGRAAIAD